MHAGFFRFDRGFLSFCVAFVLASGLDSRVLLCALAFGLLWYLNEGFSRALKASRTVQ